MKDLDVHRQAMAAGDADAFARWAAGAKQRLRLGLRCVAAAVDIEAVVQETLLRIWQVAPKVVPDGQPNCLLRLAIRVGHNFAVSELRRQKRRPDAVALLLQQAGVGAEIRPIEPDPMLRKTIVCCRDGLPEGIARVLDARLSVTPRPDKELAQELGMKLNTFLQNITRGRKLLAACLHKHGVDVDAELA